MKRRSNNKQLDLALAEMATLNLDEKHLRSRRAHFLHQAEQAPLNEFLKLR